MGKGGARTSAARLLPLCPVALPSDDSPLIVFVFVVVVLSMDLLPLPSSLQIKDARLRPCDEASVLELRIPSGPDRALQWVPLKDVEDPAAAFVASKDFNREASGRAGGPGRLSRCSPPELRLLSSRLFPPLAFRFEFPRPALSSPRFTPGDAAPLWACGPGHFRPEPPPQAREELHHPEAGGAHPRARSHPRPRAGDGVGPPSSPTSPSSTRIVGWAGERRP